MPRETYWFFRRVAELMGEGIIVLDERGKLTFMNPEAERLLGWTEAELMGRDIHDTIHYLRMDGGPLARHDCPVNNAVVMGETYRAAHDILIRRDGVPIPVSFVATPLMQEGFIVGSITVFRDIGGEIKRHEELKAARDKAERATDLKDRFVALVAHDLKNPLAALVTFLKLMDSGNPIALRAERTLRQLLDMIDTLLDINRLRTGTMRPHFQTVMLRPLAEKALAAYGIMAENKGVEAVNRISEESSVLADPDLLEVVLRNLISNAVKFSNGGGCVSVFMSAADAIVVQDAGVGIASDDIPHLFSRTENLSRKGTANETGTGLGLSLSHEIMVAHGGTIEVRSATGRGAAFTVRFPGPRGR